MYKLKLFLLTITSFSLVLFTACDEGLRVVGVELVSYPDKLFYVIGVDDSIDLSGGRAKLLLKDKSIITNDSKMDDEWNFKVTHNIDFEREGVYEITVTRYKYSFSFPVQVVSFEAIEDIVNTGIN